MNAYEFWNPFDFQPTRFNGSCAPQQQGDYDADAILGDYYRRVMKSNVFPKERDDEEDMRTEEQKAKMVGKEFVTKPESMMPKDPRKDPYGASVRLIPTTMPPEEVLMDTEQIFGPRLNTTKNIFPHPPEMKIKKPKHRGKIKHRLPSHYPKTNLRGPKTKKIKIKKTKKSRKH